MANALVLVHGYSDRGESWEAWRDVLRGSDPDRKIHVCTYLSLVNDVTIKDVAEAFERALAASSGPC